MCPCKKEYLQPPDTLWFFLLLGFAVAVGLLFLLCELLKRKQKFPSNGAVYIEPEAEIVKVNPEFSDFPVHPAGTTNAAQMPAYAAAADTEFANLSAAGGSMPPLYTVPLSSAAAPNSMGRKVKLRSAFIANSSSAEPMRTLDVRALPNALQSSSPDFLLEDSPGIELLGAPNNEDEDEISQAEMMQEYEPEAQSQLKPEMVNRSQLRIQPRSLLGQATPNAELNLPKIQLRSLPVQSNSTASDQLVQPNPNAQQLKIKLRSLPVQSNQAAYAEDQSEMEESIVAAQMNQAPETKAQPQIRTVTTAAQLIRAPEHPQKSQQASAPNQTSQAKIQLKSKPVQLLQTTQETNRPNGTGLPVVQSEMLQSSQSQYQSTTTTEISRGSQFNTASLSRLRKREYELATLLRQLRNVEFKVEHLSTELEKKDFIWHYKLNRADLLRNSSPMIYYTNGGFQSSANSIHHNSSNYTSRARSLVNIGSQLDKNPASLDKNSRQYIEQYGTKTTAGISCKTSRSFDGLNENSEKQVSSPVSLQPSRQSNGHYTGLSIPNFQLNSVQIGHDSATTVRNYSNFHVANGNRTPTPEITRLADSNGQYGRTTLLSPSPNQLRSGQQSPISPMLSEKSNGRSYEQFRTLSASGQASPKLNGNGQYGDISATPFSASRNSYEDFELDCELKLSEAIRQLRAECELRLEQNRDEQEAAYSKRESELYAQILNLANSFQLQNSEFNSVQFKLSSLEQSLSGLNDQKLTAETNLKARKSGWSEEHGSFVEEIGRLKSLIGKMELEKHELLSNYHHLQEAKTSLDTEISTYRSLLEEEEQRLDQIFQQNGNQKTIDQNGRETPSSGTRSWHRHLEMEMEEAITRPNSSLSISKRYTESEI